MNNIETTFATLQAQSKSATIKTVVAGLLGWQDPTNGDILEIQSPFSDPAAETPATQKAFEQALALGYTLDSLFAGVTYFRTTSNTPIVLRIYANPIYNYGKAAFMAKCRQVGIDAILIQDSPFAERAEFEPEATAQGIHIIHQAIPTTDHTLTTIAKAAKGFLYCLSPFSPPTTLPQDLSNLITHIRQHSNIPCVTPIPVPNAQGTVI